MNDQVSSKVVPMVEPPSRESLRAKIFTSKKPRSKLVEFMGVQIEIRQPLLEDILSLAQQSDARQSAVVSTLVQYAYVPGTNERLFSESDEEAFRAMPFGEDFTRVMNALQELTDIDFSQGRSS